MAAKQRGGRDASRKKSVADPGWPGTRGRLRWPLRIAVILVAGLALLLWNLHQRSGEFLTIQNQSGQPVARLRVTASGETKTFQDVAAGSGVMVPLGAGGDDRLTVEGELADGTLIRGQFGRSAAGSAGERAGLVILPGGQLVFRPQGKQ